MFSFQKQKRIQGRWENPPRQNFFMRLKTWKWQNEVTIERHHCSTVVIWVMTYSWVQICYPCSWAAPATLDGTACHLPSHVSWSFFFLWSWLRLAYISWQKGRVEPISTYWSVSNTFSILLLRCKKAVILYSTQNTTHGVFISYKKYPLFIASLCLSVVIRKLKNKYWIP